MGTLTVMSRFRVLIFLVLNFAQVATDWEEYEDEITGRKFYVNTSTKERSWKPPRKPRQSESMIDFLKNIILKDFHDLIFLGGSIGGPTSPRPDVTDAPNAHDSPKSTEEVCKMASEASHPSESGWEFHNFK